MQKDMAWSHHCQRQVVKPVDWVNGNGRVTAEGGVHVACEFWAHCENINACITTL